MLRSLEHPKSDARSLNELFGFVARCAAESSAHRLDYTILRSQVIQLAGGMSEAPRLIALAEFCGLFKATEVDHEGMKVTAYVIHQDLELFHLKLAAEQDWENQRKRDTRDPDMTGPARLRDGDACRYCGKTVNWKDRTSSRGATYDHRVPGQKGNLLVSCKGCNSKRKDDPEGTWPVLDAPQRPLYGPETVKFLRDLGHDVRPSYADPSVTTPPSTHDVAPSAAEGQQGTGQTHAVETPPSGEAPAETSALEAAGPCAPELAPETQQQVEHSEQAPTVAAAEGEQGPSPEPGSDLGRVAPGPGFVGSGRDGSGQVGKGRGGPGLARGGPGWDGGRAGPGGAVTRKKRRGKRGGRR